MDEISVASLMRAIPTGEAANDWLESIRWPNGPVCPHCGVIGHAYHLKPKNGGRKTRTGAITYRKIWKCGDCRKQFTVTVGTCMQGSKISVQKWALAFHLYAAGKNGVSSHELGRILDISHESAWFMSHRIRYAFSPAPDKPQRPPEGIVEADETYIGGKREHIPGIRDTDWKVPVVTLVERDGEARSVVMPTVNTKNLKDHLTGNIVPDAHLMTDQSPSYNQAGKHFAAHDTVDHTRDEWVRGEAHVNTAEGFFSQFKRSLDGTHHHVSPKHLHRYAHEFEFRYNTRKETEGERMARAIRRRAGKRMKYESVTAKPAERGPNP